MIDNFKKINDYQSHKSIKIHIKVLIKVLYWNVQDLRRIVFSGISFDQIYHFDKDIISKKIKPFITSNVSKKEHRFIGTVCRLHTKDILFICNQYRRKR